MPFIAFFFFFKYSCNYNYKLECILFGKKNGITTEVEFAIKFIYFFKVFAIINTLMF